MKRIEIASFGDKNVLKLVDAAIPKPSAHEVVVKMAGAGLNPIDYKIREGSSFAAKLFKDKLPIGLGYDLSGEIIACGSENLPFNIGDRVCGMIGFPHSPACYAEYVLADAKDLVHVPREINLVDIAGLPLAGLTALQALELVKIKPHQRVLIHAAAGGVGHLAIQLAKMKGAYVIATASPQNHPFVFALGADQCIDYHTQNVTEAAGKVDAIIDLVGGEVGLASLNNLLPTGKMVSVPSFSLEKIMAAAKSQQLNVCGMLGAPNTDQLNNLIHLVQKNQLRLHISHRFHLNEVAKAHELLESRRVVGKTIIH